MNGCGAFVE